MSADEGASSFFKAGGTLHLDAPSYVRRPTDDELFTWIKSGQFCYVLTPRQMGKSSLMIRTADRLCREGARTVIIDLSSLGTQVTTDQWYLGLIRRLAAQLELAVQPELWWHERAALGAVQRFTDFLHDVVLAEIGQPIVVFIDEIDSTLKLDFTDDFFAAIRVLYNLRANSPEYGRLTFVLLGVASPADLIADRRRTPFNVGRAVDLHEFSREDALPIERGLEALVPGHGKRILDRIFFWTNGHPYLTQRLCVDVATAPHQTWSDAEIDQAVERLFLHEEARSEDNLQFVRSNVEASSDHRQILQLYRRVLKGEAVPEDARSPHHNQLKLIGLVRAERGLLRSRNEIYRRVFNLAWVKENMPVNWPAVVTVAAVGISVVTILVAIAVFAYQSQTTRYEALKKVFLDSASVQTRVSLLTEMCKLRPKQAAEVFLSLHTSEQEAMFRPGTGPTPQAERVLSVIRCVNPTVAQQEDNPEAREAAQEAMCCKLREIGTAEAELLRIESNLECVCDDSNP